MAYDAHSNYEPPRRAYYGQTQQQAPVRQQNYQRHPQQISSEHNAQSQSYDQGYGDNYDGGYDYSYDRQVYDDAYTYDHSQMNSQAHRYDSGYGEEFTNKPPSRNPRPPQQYDQRPQPQNGQRVPGPPRAYDDPMRRPRPPPERHHQGDPNEQFGDPNMRGERPANSFPQSRSRNPMAPTPTQASSLPRNGAPRSRELDTQRMTMEEWKAKERVKMQSGQAPETVAQDNAFPMFPNGKRPSRSENKNSMSEKSPEEYGRSSTSSDQHARRPLRDRGDSYESRMRDHERHAGTYATRDEHKSESLTHDYSTNDRAPRAYQHVSPEYRNGPGTEARSDFNYHHTYAARETTPQNQNAYSYAEAYNAEIQDTYNDPDRSHLQQYHAETTRPKTAPRQQPLRPLDTDFTHPRLPAPYTDHQSMSPINIPPRPSTAHASRTTNPQSPYDPTPYAQQIPAHKQQISLKSDYDEYPHQDSGAFSFRPPQRTMTRDEEIEREMPDFDNAALAQSSNLSRKPMGSTAVSTGPFPAPDASARGSGGDGTARYQQAGQHAQFDSQQTHHPANGYADFDFGVSQDSAPDPPFADVNAPSRPPISSVTPVRQYTDDDRQLPYRPAPPRDPVPARPYGQRSGNDPPSRGPFPTHMRPGTDRSQSAGPTAGAWAPPGEPRTGSAPVARQAAPQALYPHRAGSKDQGQNGGPSLQQSTNPDALPHHPVPVRLGLMESGSPQPARPPPVRNYDNITSSQPQSKPPPSDAGGQPITQAGLNQLRASVDASPNHPQQALTLVRKLAEAAVVLANEGGRADPKTTAKNRERYSNEAYKRLKKLVGVGYPDAIFYLADCYGSGNLGVQPDSKEAFTLYQTAAKAGHPQAAFRTAVCCEIGPEAGGGTRKDFSKAVQWYRRAAALGDVAAMYKTGAILLKGLLGQPKNIGEGVNWLKRSADKADANNLHALHELGSLYEPLNTDPEIRNKVIADEGYARELFQRAAKLGFKASQFRLGQAYEYGTLGVAIDNRTSIAWYSKAAAQGEHQAELALSGWYLTGAEGILQQSDTEAYLWARKAASSEPPLAKAMFAMGYFTEQGIGCPSNLDEARRWYGRAASYKFPKALERLEELKNVKNGKGRPLPPHGKLSRKDQKKDEAECVVM